MSRSAHARGHRWRACSTEHPERLRKFSHQLYCRQDPSALECQISAGCDTGHRQDKYNEFAGKAAGFGLVKKEDANIQQYVTGKSLDGLYLMIGEEERKIRQDPVGTGSAILQKVFGALKQSDGKK